MLRNIVALMMLSLVVFGAAAQDDACTIAAVGADSGNRVETIYVPSEGGYTPAPMDESTASRLPDMTMPSYVDHFDAETAIVSVHPVDSADGRLGEALFTHPLDAATFARAHWLTETLFAVTDCADGACRVRIFNVETGEETSLDLGPYLPEAYLPWRDSSIVTRLPDGALGLWDHTGAFRQYAPGEQVASRPLLSSSGRYVALRMNTGDGPRLRILDLFDSKLHRTLRLIDVLPEAADEVEPPGIYPQLPAFGLWHPAESKLLYTDDGAAHVFDALANREVALIDDAGAAQWVCPPAQ